MPLGIGINRAEFTTVSVLLASGMHTGLLHVRREREVVQLLDLTSAVKCEI